VARHPSIRVTALETALGTRYTADSLGAIRERFPRIRFVWLMGADNLEQISDWQNWPQIFHLVVIAVFDRPSYSLGAGNAKAARRFARWRVAETRARCLAGLAPPAWTYIHNRLIAKSATQIRARGRATRPGPVRGV
jgi:nicotinate-nucleotide adenylyltransferase